MRELGPTFMNIWTCESSPRSGSRNAWTRSKNVNGDTRLSKFWNIFGAIEMISFSDCWPWTKPGYITMTRRQSSGGTAAHPVPKKNPSAKIPWKTTRLDSFGSRRHPPHWLSSKGQTNAEYNLSLLVQLREVLREKRRVNLTKRFLIFHDNAPPHRSIATQKRLSYLGFQCLHHPPYSPDLAPSDYHLFRGLKVNWKSSFFVRRKAHCCRRDLVGRTNCWFLFFFFLWLAKFTPAGEKCIEFRGDYVE